MNDVMFVRLNNGEDLVTQFTTFESDDESYYSITEPMKILYTTNENGYLSITLMQWVFNRISSRQSFNISPSDVLVISEASEGMTKYYWDCIDHYKNNKNIAELSSEDEQDDVFDEPTTEEEAMKIINEFLGGTLGKKDKRNLH